MLAIFAISCNKIDKNNFDFSTYLSKRNDIIKELKFWGADTAYIEFIGFAPSSKFEYYQSNSIDNMAFNHLSKEFFKEYDLENPIMIVHALRKNTVSGNSFKDSGISSSDMVDYENGVGRSDAKNLHKTGNYSNTTYEYSSFTGMIRNGKFKMLSYGYVEDRAAINFSKKIIVNSLGKKMLGKNKGLIITKPNNAGSIGFYTKNSDKIEMIEYKKCQLLNIDFPQIILKNLNVDKFSNGESIREAKTDNEWIDALNKKEPAWCNYKNIPTNGQKDGYIYNWYAVNDKRGLAPNGWHVITETEWTQFGKFGFDFDYLVSMARTKKGDFYPGSSWWSSAEATEDDGYYLSVPDERYPDKAVIEKTSKGHGLTVLAVKNN